uniref:Uncharacterized protein n=1 Tax=Anopheles atroparvus TaxID=41427 RepID=A0A182IPN5_ANOAO
MSLISALANVVESTNIQLKCSGSGVGFAFGIRGSDGDGVQAGLKVGIAGVETSIRVQGSEGESIQAGAGFGIDRSSGAEFHAQLKITDETLRFKSDIRLYVFISTVFSSDQKS